MDLIIKPTELCNFKCTFCSSSSISPQKTQQLDHETIFSFLKRYPQTKTIIVNGGDPLMLPPLYYWKIISFLDQHDMPTTLSFTTNLWDFYKNPEKWIDLFKNPRVGVATSFNYGETRRITNMKVFREKDFWAISDLFLKEIGYRPSFISVITPENEDTAIDNVRLAKEMDVECKLNYAMASGEQSKPYLLSKIYEKYIEIHEANLTAWEFNTKQMIYRMQKKPTICPQTRSCDEGIRCLQPAGDYYSCGAFGDDQEYQIDFENEVSNKNFETPLQNALELLSLKEECLTCPMFDICNGCKKTVSDLKRHQLVEDHCQLMKKNQPKITALKNIPQDELLAIEELTPRHIEREMK